MTGLAAPRGEPDPPRSLGVLLIYGSGVSRETLEELSVHFECFLEEVDRGTSSSGQARFRWVTVDPEFEGRRIIVGPERMDWSGADRTIERILEQVRRGIGAISGTPRRPPGFTDGGLEHLEAVASVLEDPEVSRLAFYTGREVEPISPATLSNLRRISD